MCKAPESHQAGLKEESNSYMNRKAEWPIFGKHSKQKQLPPRDPAPNTDEKDSTDVEMTHMALSEMETEGHWRTLVGQSHIPKATRSQTQSNQNQK